MDKASQPPHTHLFTMRLWLEELGEEQREWRGEVHYVVSGERAQAKERGNTVRRATWLCSM